MSSPHAKRIEFQKSIVAQQVWATCLNCMNWTHHTQYDADGVKTEWHGCSKAGGAVPPPLVILHSCEAWEGDIPF